MSMNELERQVWMSAQVKLRNPKLRKKDVLEWSSGIPKPEEGEVMTTVKVYDAIFRVCVLKKDDNRTDEQRAEHEKEDANV